MQHYRFQFAEVIDSTRSFSAFSSRENKTIQASVTASYTGFQKGGRFLDPQVADLIDLAVAVSTADRLAPCWDGEPSIINIGLSVRDPEPFLNPAALTVLENVLYWYTGDEWRFDFTRHAISGSSPQQGCLVIDAEERPREIALWSGGLDAFAGLSCRMLGESHKHFTLVGTGSNSIMHERQKRTAMSIEETREFKGRTKLVRAPINVTGVKGMPKNNSLRARGFVFLLIGAIYAYLEGRQELNVYENGIGAINLPFRASEVGLDHARSVNPISLLDMGVLVTILLGIPFAFKNPFLFSTKGEMCSVVSKAGYSALMLGTISCDRLRREHGLQCGACSSCILRRQALLAAGVDDINCYVMQTSPSTRRTPSTTHLDAMLNQVDLLQAQLSSRNPWRALSGEFVTLADIVDLISTRDGMPMTYLQEHLVCLYQRYVEEWKAVRSHFEQHPTPYTQGSG